MSRMLLIAKRDVLTYFSNFYGIGYGTVSLCAQLLVFGYILGKVISSFAIEPMTYLQFFALGSVVISLFGASYTIGRDIFLDRESGFLNYLLTLPISRMDIVLGRALGGAIRSLLSMSILYAIALTLVPTSFINVLECIIILFTFSFGLCSLGILLATSIRQEAKWRLVVGLLDLLMIRSSTAMYPISAMPVWLQVVTRFNPLSYGADSLRGITFHLSSTVISDSITILLIFSFAMGLSGITLYSRKLEAGVIE